MKQFGDRLAELRSDQSMTQKQLAGMLYVSPGTISNYENNVYYPDVEKLIALADLFHVTTDNLLGRSSGCMIDVSGLTAKQRNAIQDVVTTYQAFNRLHRQYAAGDVDAIYDGGDLKSREGGQ